MALTTLLLVQRHSGLGVRQQTAMSGLSGKSANRRICMRNWGIILDRATRPHTYTTPS